MGYIEQTKVYLGDGVYAAWDGYYILLTTENGVETTNRILLDNGTLNAMLKFVKHIEAVVKGIKETAADGGYHQKEDKHE